MTTKTLKFGSLIIIGSLFVFSCNSKTDKQSITNEESEINEVEVKTEVKAPIAIAPEFDPMIIGKEYSKVFGDSLGIQMYELTLKPGDSMGLHKHLDHSAYVLEGGKLLVYFDGTNPVEMDLPKGFGFISGPVTDAAVNIGDTDITLLMHEILRPRE